MILKGVIFDLDGTLADTLPVCYAAFRATFDKHLGRMYTDAEIAATFGPSEEGSFRNEAPACADACLQTYLEEYDKAHALCPTPFPGIEDALQRLTERGVPIAIVTGKGEHSAAISMRHLGLSPYFEIVEAGSPHGPIKPQAIRKVLERWQLPAEQVAYVGDSPSDITHAREAGAHPLAAAWATTANFDALNARSPLALFRTVAEFHDWLQANLA